MAANIVQTSSRSLIQIFSLLRNTTKLALPRNIPYSPRSCIVFSRWRLSSTSSSSNGTEASKSNDMHGHDQIVRSTKSRKLLDHVHEGEGISANKEPRLLRVAIIGEPNSGKSTLINSLVGEKVFAVTEKPHTTRQLASGVFMRGDAQIVLLDTPGIVAHSEVRRLKMTREHITAPENALQEADIIGVLCDAADKRTRERIHEQILLALDKHRNIASFLILNKTDKLRHKVDLLALAVMLTEDRGKDQWGYTDSGGWSKFDNVFMISAQVGDGIEDLKEYLAVRARPADWLYPPDICTDLGFEKRIVEIFREKLLQLYEHEIPWQVKQVTVLCELREGNQLRIHQKLYCRKKSQRKCVLEKVEALRDEVKTEIEATFGCALDLSIDVGVSEKLGFKTPLPVY